ncbi:MAG: Gfo/Idh/MocA family oxidoreductase [Planctomycetes bacterium]|nr:Gfo/Idh/MocA family oxidoreductase [Planctomycetota bacterium]
MQDTINCGIVGCGTIAPLHAECLQKISDVRITWACDLVTEKARSLGEKFSIEKITSDVRELLQDPRLDAVHVCTDHASHAAISIAALEAGKHVLCEKALTAQPDALRSMLEAGKKCPDQIFSGVFQHRFEPAMQYVQRLVDSENLGTLLTASVQAYCLRTEDYYRSASWRGTWKDEGGGVLINQAIHFIDCLNWIMGGVASLSGAFSNRTHPSIEVEDTAVAALRFRNGCLGVIEASSSTDHTLWSNVLSIQGSKGCIEVRNNKVTRAVFSDPALQAKVDLDLARLHEPPPTATGKGYYGPGHPAQIADFIDCIRTGRAPWVSASSAMSTVELVHAIYASARRGCWMDLLSSPTP